MALTDGALERSHSPSLISLYYTTLGHINQCFHFHTMVMAEPMRTFDLPIAHFPREDPGIVLTIGLNALQDLLTDVLLGSGTTQDTGTDAACLLVAVQDF